MMYGASMYIKDSPGGKRRLIQKPVGVRHTVVNSVMIVEDRDRTDIPPGKLLRSLQ
jgi:hypothetical protein